LEVLAKLIATDIPEGSFVNLGIGLPTNVSKFLPKDKDIFLHSLYGVLAFGPPPQPGEEDQDLDNAGQALVNLLDGGRFMH
ncbi:CoA-transferase, partial [Acinetobacter baumannii]|uniref:CoA-transferase n=1 Tax=Acinetobacter baumannii TaxID=470 RepID=UPI000ADE15C1